MTIAICAIVVASRASQRDRKSAIRNGSGSQLTRAPLGKLCQRRNL
jgi:hypothetical protein